jgi:hypothetical protein
VSCPVKEYLPEILCTLDDDYYFFSLVGELLEAALGKKDWVSIFFKPCLPHTVVIAIIIILLYLLVAISVQCLVSVVVGEYGDCVPECTTVKLLEAALKLGPHPQYSVPCFIDYHFPAGCLRPYLSMMMVVV